VSGTQQALTEDEYNHVDSYHSHDGYSVRETLAIEFAERFALEHRDIDRAFFERMRVEYNDAEIVELAGAVAFSMGIGRVSKVLDIANECPVVHDSD
jgi:alkylhydroperoxidase family enzyme